MSYDIDVVAVQAVQFARVQRMTKRDQIGEVAMPALDLVSAAVRSAGASTGHNVFVYRLADGSNDFDMEMGVQVFGEVVLPPGEVTLSWTPSGRAVRTTHVGPYSRLAGAYDALHEWRDRENAKFAGLAWEVYGDWKEDEDELETDVYYLLSPNSPS